MRVTIKIHKICTCVVSCSKNGLNAHSFLLNFHLTLGGWGFHCQNFVGSIQVPYRCK
jgi:hypothetical protein